jgi:hypothetical protein
MLVSCIGVVFNPEDRVYMFYGNAGVVSPKMEFFIITAVSTSFSTCLSFVENWMFIVAELKLCRLNSCHP